MILLKTERVNMYLHLGNDVMINSKYLIGIFDIEKSSISKFTKEYLTNAEKAKRIVNVSYELPKSFIVCLDEDFNETVYISQISTATLKKRFAKKENKI